MTYISSFWTTSVLATADNSSTNRLSSRNVSASFDLRNTSTVFPSKTSSCSDRMDIGHSDTSEQKMPLLDNPVAESNSSDQPQIRVPLVKQVTNAIIQTLKAVIATLTTPGQYLLACFYDKDGRFSARMSLYMFGRGVSETSEENEPSVVTLPAISEDGEEKLDESPRNKLQRRSSRFRRSIAAADSLPSPQVYLQTHTLPESATFADDDSPSRHTRSKSSLNQVTEDGETAAPPRSTRIKIVNQDVLRQRRLRREQRDVTNFDTNTPSDEPLLTISTIKSPTSSLSSSRSENYDLITSAPRPLVPRRQPSYTALNQSSSKSPQKTLIIDLDETLIHSMAKGGRMSTGHMVEVKLDSPVGAASGIIGPQVPILYYVHKRPHCDEFLRKVSKWYNLIVFTASVQEYADPVVDWLELERKYFSARYYRQHCTYRSGAYIKDLSTVEPDLARVMILDNSPLSYVFHEDNAIPIEGWISDPTDNDLLNLIPVLEGLQYTTDVRSLLALRLGEGKER